MQGQCICGQTTFECELTDHHVSVCHCSICRRQASGVMMTINIQADSLKFTQEQHLSIYDSSEWGERGFCNACGSNLFWRSKDQKYCNINAFSLNENISDLALNMQIFIDNKPDFYSFQNVTQQLTEAEVIALFSDHAE